MTLMRLPLRQNKGQALAGTLGLPHRTEGVAIEGQGCVLVVMLEEVP
jgi:hypothetical protein